MSQPERTRLPWHRERPHALVVACSDGRLQENLDDFLHRELGIANYDRLYAPGGGGALATGGYELLRADLLLRELRFLLEAHPVRDLIVVFHGPAGDGPEEACCGDYRRKFPTASADEIRREQARDAEALKALDWGSEVRVRVFCCEVRGDDTVQFIPL